jgi:hypothetical protein
MLLRPGGVYLVGDHVAGSAGMENVDLYMPRGTSQGARTGRL